MTKLITDREMSIWVIVFRTGFVVSLIGLVISFFTTTPL